MISEIAVTPSVFQIASYTSREECDAYLQGISKDLLERLLVRNLRDGDWLRGLLSDKTRCPHTGQKLLSQLKKSGHLRNFPAVLTTPPTDSLGWCGEALASHEQAALSGILTCKAVAAEHKGNSLVAPITQRNSCDWWNAAVDGGPPRILRSKDALIAAFGRLLKVSSHVMFLDPHLDPERNDYRDFVDILETCKADIVEIHRVCYVGINGRTIVANEEWERRFRSKLGPIAKKNGFKLKVVIWADEHDRHLVTNLMSFHLGNGFGTTNDPTKKMTCTRLSRSQSDEIQRDFDPQVKAPLHRFLVGNSEQLD